MCPIAAPPCSWNLCQPYPKATSGRSCDSRPCEEEERVLRELSSAVGAVKDDLLLGMDMLAAD